MVNSLITHEHARCEARLFIVARTRIYRNEAWLAQTGQYALWACSCRIAPKGRDAVHTRCSRCFKSRRVLDEYSSFLS